jgi:4'-phosphopantetheinyl transferase
LTKSRAQIAVVVARLDVSAEALDACSALLSNAEHERARRFVFERDRRRFTVARARLRELLAARLGVRAAAVELEYGPHGKPVLAPPLAASGLCFNLSHAGELAAYAFSVGHEVGIDIEEVSATSHADDIAERFFSRGENKAYRALPETDRPQAFFLCWTRKEAFVKALGWGLGYALDSFDVSLSPAEPARILRVGDVPGEASGWVLFGFDPAPGFAGAVVARAELGEAAPSSLDVEYRR